MKTIIINFKEDHQADQFMEVFTDHANALHEGLGPIINELMDYSDVSSVHTIESEGIIDLS